VPAVWQPTDYSTLASFVLYTPSLSAHRPPHPSVCNLDSTVSYLSYLPHGTHSLILPVVLTIAILSLES